MTTQVTTYPICETPAASAPLGRSFFANSVQLLASSRSSKLHPKPLGSHKPSRWQLGLKRLFLLLAFVTLTSACYVPFSVPGCRICDIGPSCEGFAEFLYWKPCAPYFPYAIRGTRVQVLKPRYQPGFSFGLQLNSVNRRNIAVGAYTQLDSRTKRTLKGAFNTTLPVVDGRASRATAGLVYRYKAGFLFGGRYVYCKSDFRFYLFGGGRYLYAERYQQIETPEHFYKQQFTFQGGGPEFGIGGESANFCGFYGTGRFSIAGLMGVRTDNGRIGLRRIKTHRHSTCVPALIMRLGIAYVRCYTQFHFTGKVGYELATYFQAIEGNTFAEGPDILTTTKHNFGVGGPYVSLGVQF